MKQDALHNLTFLNTDMWRKAEVEVNTLRRNGELLLTSTSELWRACNNSSIFGSSPTASGTKSQVSLLDSPNVR